MRWNFKRKLIIGFFVVIVISCVFISLRLYKKYPVKNKKFEITSMTNIPRYLDDVIFENSLHEVFWRGYLKFFGYDKKIRAGSYVLTEDSLSRVKLISILMRGSNDSGVKVIRVVEGWENFAVSSYLTSFGVRNDGIIEKSKIADFKDRFSYLNGSDEDFSLQGYLFPDTYEIFSNVTEEEVVIKMLENFDKKFTQQMREDIRKQGRQLSDVVNLASIIEREVRTLSSKKIVAGIFLNRLKIGMPLQSDATINFITKSGRSRSTFDDLSIDSPYNTYKYNGLPPGPIANPGLDSLLATTYPQENEYLFFLTTDDGDIYFAKTFEEHVKNKRRYLP